MIDLDKLTQALDKTQASLDRIYRFLGCPKPSQDPEGFARWLREHGSEPGGAAPQASETVACDKCGGLGTHPDLPNATVDIGG